MQFQLVYIGKLKKGKTSAKLVQVKDQKTNIFKMSKKEKKEVKKNS